MNLRKGSLVAVSWGPGAEPLPLALARTVRFGIPGTSMPGHETLAEDQVADLVALLQSWLPADFLEEADP